MLKMLFFSMLLSYKPNVKIFGSTSNNYVSTFAASVLEQIGLGLGLTTYVYFCHPQIFNTFYNI